MLPEVHSVAVGDLRPGGDVPPRHQDGRLVDVAAQGVGVAAVVDQRQTRVDGGPDPLPLKTFADFMHRVEIECLGTDHLVNNSQNIGLNRSKSFYSTRPLDS